MALGNDKMRPGLSAQGPDFSKIPDTEIHFVFIFHIL